MAFLYDFLYLDQDRVASLYAQIFGGIPLSIDEISRKAEQLRSDIKAGVPFLGTSLDFNDQISEEKKVTTDPHHVRTIDLLATLVKLAEESSSILVASGSLKFMDRFLVKIIIKTMNIFDVFIQNVSKKDKKTIQSVVRTIEAFFETAPILPAFLLKTDQGLLGGTLNEKYLSEPITSFYLKFGNKWLEEVNIIGLIEETSEGDLWGTEHLLHAAKEMLPVFSSLVFPEGTVMVTPVAILRRLAPLPEGKDETS